LILTGGWSLRADGHTIDLAPREQRLLALLALRGTMRRPYAAGTLWPDSSEQHALSNLRASAWHVRNTGIGLLQGDRTTIALAPNVTTDVAIIRSCISEVSDVPSSVDSDQTLDVLGANDLLPGWYDDWVLIERERLRDAQIQALTRHAQFAINRGDFELAIRAATLSIQLEPLLEDAQAILITAHLATGQSVAAIQCYIRFYERLRLELGIAPSPRLSALLSHLGVLRRHI
jgi:SARP family transcriptional regulator, regulator of embCAB operon